MTYSQFAAYYDRFTKNVDYRKRMEFVSARFGALSGQILDIGCGTGTFSVLLAKAGYDVIALDASGEMLALASEKAAKQKADILFLQQDIQNLDLYGTVRGAVSTLDVFNHIASAQTLQKAFDKLACFMEAGGLFIFDMNMPYKHHTVLRDAQFIFEDDSAVCIWRNEYDEKLHRVAIDIDVFALEAPGLYRRAQESFYEYSYDLDKIEQLLHNAKFTLLETIDGETYEKLCDTSQRVLFVAKRN